jgi:hypothetical protein
MREALRFVQAVAVLGDGTSLDLAVRLADVVERSAIATADDLATVGILAPGLPLGFAHPLLGAAVHADVPPVARQVTPSLMHPDCRGLAQVRRAAEFPRAVLRVRQRDVA